MFFKPKTSPRYDFVIAGLGNPGDKYDYTRHNAGFLAVDRLADTLNCKIKKVKFKSVFGDAVIAGKRCLLVKPQTYMNNSGEAVREICDFYKIPISCLIVLSDDITLPVGKIRIRRSGSHGGQNGIKSIINHCGSSEFPRIRIGIGEKPHPDYDLAAWVLSKFKPDEEKPLAEALDNAGSTAKLIVEDKISEAMNKFN